MHVFRSPFRWRAFARNYRLEAAPFLLATATTALRQIANVANNQSALTTGVEHDCIGDLNDIVSHDNGSLSIRIAVPTPQGRGLTLPFQFSTARMALSSCTHIPPALRLTLRCQDAREPSDSINRRVE